VELETARAKAAVLIEALPYLQKFRGRTMVVKLGGAAIGPGGNLADALFSVVFLSQVGVRPVLVHGGGPFITQAMRQRGKEPTFVRGQRMTDAETLAIVEDVLINVVNARLSSQVEALGGSAVGLHSRHGKPLLAERLLGTGEDGSPIDLGFVGRVFSVKTGVINEVLDAGAVPVIAPLAVTLDGETLNCNADNVAWTSSGTPPTRRPSSRPSRRGRLRNWSARAPSPAECSRRWTRASAPSRRGSRRPT